MVDWKQRSRGGSLEGHDDEKRARVRRSAVALLRGCTTEWDGTSLHVRTSQSVLDGASDHASRSRQALGVLQTEWLPYASTASNGWLLDRHGHTYKPCRSQLAQGTMYLRDIVTWTWKAAGSLSFRYVGGHGYSSAPTTRAFQRVSLALLYNFLRLLLRPDDAAELRPYGRYSHLSWHFTDDLQLEHRDATLVVATTEGTTTH